MNEIWFTSDNHWGHRSIFSFCPHTRKGETLEEHDEILIQKWNEHIKPHDTVYMLGDTFFCDLPRAIEIISRLNGRLHLIYGNHDGLIKNNDGLQRQFEWCQDYARLVIGGTVVVLHHYPIYEWDAFYYGSYHLFGHVHGAYDMDPLMLGRRAMDVGIDSRPAGVEQWGGPMTPWNWYQVDEILKNRPIPPHPRMQYNPFAANM